MRYLFFIKVLLWSNILSCACFAQELAFLNVAENPVAIATGESAETGNNEDKIRISIQSIPAGAKVYINNKYYGLAPVRLSARSGQKVNIVISKEGYKNWTRETVLSGNTNIVAALLPATERAARQPAPRGTQSRGRQPLSIESNPSGAKVYAQFGKRKRLLGRTPLQFVAPAGSKFSIFLVKDGYKIRHKRIDASGEQNIFISLNARNPQNVQSAQVDRDIPKVQRDQPGSKKWPWLIGAAVGGGIAYLLSTSGTPPAATGAWPKPPGRP